MPVDLDNATRIVAASSDGRMYSRYPAGNAPSAAWNLPASLNVLNDGTVGLRQYVVNGGDWTISVSGLPTGVTYNSSLERLEGASSGSASATATFTLTLGGVTVQTTATVALVAVGGYTLANAIAGLPFTVNTPTAPTITSEATVTPATIGANMVNGRRLILTAGSYGNLTFGTQDQEIVLTTGVTIGTLTISSTARRLHFRADPVRSGRIYRVNMGGSFESGLVTDVLWDGLYVDDTGNPSQNSWCGTRVAVINSEVRGDSYAGANFGNIVDFIWANCLIHTYGMTQANVRSHGALRYVVVDSRLMKTGSLNHTFRLHGDSVGSRTTDYAYIGRNQLDGARTIFSGDGSAAGEFPGGAGPSSGLNNVWVEDNTFYNPGPTGNASFYTGDPQQESDRPQMMYVRRNTLYTDMGTWYTPSTPRPNWVDEDNVHLPYQAPPSWSFA